MKPLTHTLRLIRERNREAIKADPLGADHHAQDVKMLLEYIEELEEELMNQDDES